MGPAPGGRARCGRERVCRGQHRHIRPPRRIWRLSPAATHVAHCRLQRGWQAHCAVRPEAPGVA
eukprot:2935475-Pyramimonas_sp.AAC.1